MKKLLPILVLASSGCASRLFYYPDRTVYQTPDQKGLAFEEVAFASGDGTRLTGWFIPARGKAAGTVIHFHGNAQNMTAHFAFVDWLPKEGFNVFTFDYRGYGRSEGQPDRRGVHADCIAALDYVRKRPDVDPTGLVVFGQSLGGANALAVLGEDGTGIVRAVAIESTFYSYRSVVRDKIRDIPLVGIARWPLSFLVIGNGHSPGSVVQNIAPTPLLLIHGDADRVISYHHAEDLYRKACQPKQLWTITNGDHTEAFTVYAHTYRERLVEFFNSALKAPPQPPIAP